MAVAARSGLSWLTQEDFSGGAYPQQERIPDNACEDIVNGLIDDDGSIFRRGGCGLMGTAVASSSQPWINLWTGFLGTTGEWVVASHFGDTPVVHQKVYASQPGVSDFTFVFNMLTSIPQQRPVAYNGMVIFVGPAGFPGAGINVAAWGGSSTPDVTGQTVTVTKDSKTATGTGTSWLSTLTPGMILYADFPFGDQVGVVESIESNTSLTLLRPWPSASGTQTMAFKQSLAVTTAEFALPTSQGPVYATTIFDRLVYARGNRVTFTGGNDPLGVFGLDYHELPSGASVVGMEPLRDQLLVFSTRGVFVISNMAYNLTDAQGNPQQRLDRVAPDVVLWNDLGITAWRGAVIAPCVDDVYLIDSAASMRPITGGMRKLYRSYVRAGYQTGQAAVFDGRYVLPILNGSTWIDTLVCDLRTGAWTRWDGQAGVVRGLASRISVDASGIGDARSLVAVSLRGSSPPVLDVAFAFDPDDAGYDADGSVPELRVTTRQFTVGTLRRWFGKLRARVEGAWNLEVSRDGEAFQDVMSSPRTVGDALTWVFGKRARQVRFRLTAGSTVPADGPSHPQHARLRSLETALRQVGRQ